MAQQTQVTKVRIGLDDEVIGIVELTPDGALATSSVDPARFAHLLQQMRRGIYAQQSNAEFLADLPNRLRSHMWAVDISGDRSA